VKRKQIKKFLFLFSFFFLFSLITQPFSNVQAATKKNSFSTEASGNNTSLKGTGATPDSPGSNLTTTAVKQPTTAAPGSNTGGNSTGTNSSSSATTAAKKDDKTKVSDEGRKYPTEIDKPLEKVCYDMVCDTLNVTLGKDMKEVITGNTTTDMMKSMKPVYTDIVSPVGEALIVLFFLIELIDKTTKDNFSVEHFFKLMLKVVIAKFLIENGWDILTGCINVGSNLAGAITSDPKGLTSKSKVLDQYAKEIQETNTIGNLGMIIQWFLPWVFAWISKMICIVICWGRMIELGVRAVTAPISMADIFQDGTHSGGFRYLRKFLGVCLQAAVIMIVIQASGIIQGLIIGKDTVTMFKAVVVGLSTCMLVVRSQQFASDLVGA
jgi:hypothetical protein